MHMWRLALAVAMNQRDAKERLQKIEAQRIEPIRTTERKNRSPGLAVEELGKLRTFAIPELPKQSGSAEFYLLLSARDRRRAVHQRIGLVESAHQFFKRRTTSIHSPIRGRKRSFGAASYLVRN